MVFCRWLLVWVGAAAAGCAHDGAMHAPVADAAAPRPWFCQTDATGRGWFAQINEMPISKDPREIPVASAKHLQRQQRRP